MTKTKHHQVARENLEETLQNEYGDVETLHTHHYNVRLANLTNFYAYFVGGEWVAEWASCGSFEDNTPRGDAETLKEIEIAPYQVNLEEVKAIEARQREFRLG
jgi:hypothetical protein